MSKSFNVFILCDKIVGFFFLLITKDYINEKSNGINHLIEYWFSVLEKPLKDQHKTRGRSLNGRNIQVAYTHELLLIESWVFNFHIAQILWWKYAISYFHIFNFSFNFKFFRLPIWPYAKLIVTCWLVLPHFNGAAYVYRNFIRPFYMNPQTAAKIWYIPRKKNIFSQPDDVLTAAEKYIEEHGPEAFERLMSKVWLTTMMDVWLCCYLIRYILL